MDVPLRLPRGAAPVTVSEATKKSLSPSGQRLLVGMQLLRYGRFPIVPVKSGEPVLDDLHGVRTVKLGGDNTPHPGSAAEDFPLRRDVVEFFRLIAALGDGEIRNLEIRNGLPFSFEVHETLRV